MPDAPTSILFLGDRSPYGLSVARALLASGLNVGRVVVPSLEAYGAILARASGAGRSDALGPAELFRRALERTKKMMEPAGREVEGGEPIPPLVLDPGVTGGELEASCAAAGIAWRRVDDIRSEAFLAGLRGEADLFLSAAFPMIFGKALLSIPPIGSINFHPSLLPRCRGCHPIFWTLASGETQGGVTAHFMTRDVDAGDIVAQIPLPLTEEDGYQSLYQRAMDASERLVAMLEEFLAAGGGPGVPQDASRATYFHEDTEEDHRVHWAGRSPREVVALARTGEAFITARGGRLGILKAVETRTVARERRHAAPGQVLAVNDDALVVSAAGGAVALRSLAWRGRRYRGGELARGLGIRRGEVLG